MRILIVGAGIGGMSLAALLEQRGMKPRIVERAPNFEHAGYMLGIYSLGSRILHGLGLFERLKENSLEQRYYKVSDDRGREIKSWSLDPFTDLLGPIQMTTRPELVKILHSGLKNDSIEFGATIDAIKLARDEVRVRFSDGSTDSFDLLVGADGMESKVRKLIFGEVPRFHTGWGGWVWWADPSLLAGDTFAELWGRGRFLGAYPTPQGIGVIAIAPAKDGFDRNGAGRRDRIRERFAGMGPLVDGLLKCVPEDDAAMYFWHLSDVRSAEWVKGRVVLLGDAAAGFLPTAGVGASMAMESAAVLSDELSRTDNQFLEHSLMLYVKRRKSRVEKIQQDSRNLAKLMFVRSRLVAKIRDFSLRFYSLESLAKSIAKSFDEPI